MIHSLRGRIIMSDPIKSTAVIECFGVGYSLTLTSGALKKLPAPDSAEEILVYTYLQVKEDGIELFGFCDLEEQNMFRMLISVSGIGPRAAVSILSVMTPEELAYAVAAEDAKAISKAQGIGGKTAARVVLELKDKLSKLYTSESRVVPSTSASTQENSVSDSDKLKDAYNALTVLGYSKSEITAALKKVNVKASLEDIIKAALSVLMKQL